MERKDILASPEYWETLIQTTLYDCAKRYMESENINRTQLAERLGVSKGYVSQLLNGDFDHRLSKLVELALAFGYVPKFDLVKIDEYKQTQDHEKKAKAEPRAGSVRKPLAQRSVSPPPPLCPEGATAEGDNPVLVVRGETLEALPPTSLPRRGA